jgi:hypothetical protein
MKGLVIGAVAAVLVLAATIESVGAEGRPVEDGRAHGIGIASGHTSGPDETKVTFSDLIVSSGRPIDTGGSN